MTMPPRHSLAWRDAIRGHACLACPARETPICRRTYLFTILLQLKSFFTCASYRGCGDTRVIPWSQSPSRTRGATYATRVSTTPRHFRRSMRHETHWQNPLTPKAIFFGVDMKFNRVIKNTCIAWYRSIFIIDSSRSS